MAKATKIHSTTLTQNDCLVYWMNERQRIFLRREAGAPAPWTDDPILRGFKFTNVFREQDRETRELRRRLRGRMAQADIFWRTCVFRLFNWHETYDALNEAGLVERYDASKAGRVLKARAANGHKVFTGAYIVSNNGSSRSKIDLICDGLTAAFANRADLSAEIRRGSSIEAAVKILAQLPNVGRFVAYEIATDLRHTPILSRATDIYRWANPGPGAVRGLNRLHGRPLKAKPSVRQCVAEMRELLTALPSLLDAEVFRGHTLEMRDVEHSLCEFDKYMRVKNGEGRPRSRYRYAPN